ncbi:helix-turn-helix domain-containing protein [Isobaculum melis]|uniref:Transcriptional activator, Rgg/GadR/MutR family, C-terminal domain-containing protein n=1 Tax=Isobaculum melis TaxID=142588 RepID=A0A1H9PTI1_9LACT|nr:Rgg/GadR/MutR family transcriptional regulator [Isobaculum melis]SER51145.1 transcriptional activator, Rgg/GadR/MutR family, C-terminal domain-containing protein [Isobaculum melis]
MKKIGQTLRLLRQSKGLSQREVAEGVMDFSYYNRVENDKVNISFSKLLLLLENFDISIEEFMFLNENNNKKDLRTLIADAYYLGNIQTLLKLEKLCIKQFEESDKILFRHSFILCRLLFARRNNEKLEQRYIDEIVDYLNSLSYYTRNDVRMLSDFYDILPTEMVFFLFEQMCIGKKKHSIADLSGFDMLVFHFNVIDLAIKHEKYSLAKKILEETKKEFFNPLNLLAVTICNYYDGLFLILFGNDAEQGTKLAEETIVVLESCKLKYQAQRHKEFLEEIKAKVQPI